MRRGLRSSLIPHLSYLIPDQFTTLWCFAVGDLDERAAVDLHASKVDVVGALVLGLVHQAIGALNELRGEPPRDEAARGHTAEPEADDANIHGNRLGGQSAILRRPVEALDGFTESFPDRMRLLIFSEIRCEEAELVAAEACVQILGARAGQF